MQHVSMCLSLRKTSFIRCHVSFDYHQDFACMNTEFVLKLHDYFAKQAVRKPPKLWRFRPLEPEEKNIYKKL